MTELYDDIIPIYNLKPENPRQRDCKMIREVQSIEYRTKYTLPFTDSEAQKLWDMRDTKCALVIKDESRRDKSPIGVGSFEQFKSRPFDELWDLVATPRYKLDKSYKDQMNDTQYS
jgi:hypothetical protein